MTEEKTVYLDSLLLDNKIILVVFILQSVILFISGVEKLETNLWFGYAKMFFAAMLFSGIIFQLYISRKHNRKYFKFYLQGLEIKDSIFKNSKKINWTDIDKVKFVGKNTIVNLKSPEQPDLKIKASLERDDEVRSAFRKFTKETDVELEF